VWDHLAGAVSAPFEAGEHERIAGKPNLNSSVKKVVLEQGVMPAEPVVSTTFSGWR
jgi:hypothetical protein